MTRLQSFALLAWLSPAFIVAPAFAGQPLITSKAQLTHYLQNTPPGQSPLDELSPGGRKRFLTQLNFGQHGLRGISRDDPESELTHPQIVRLLALFGAEKYARGGLTPAEQARFKREQAMDAAARGCVVKSCAETEVERRYDELVKHDPDASLSDAQRFAFVGQQYDRLFKSYQTPQRLRSATHPDLRLRKRAVEYTIPLLPSPTHIAQLQLDLAEMQRRSMIDDRDYTTLHQALITSRDFNAAETLVQRHPSMNVDAVPTFRKPVSLPPGQPTALTVRGGSMTRQSFNLSAPLRIVVVASCHFSEDAARAIEADPQLRPIFANNAIWLASQNEHFSSVKEWNREFPDQPIHIAWQDSEWSMLDSWAMPTFYVFRNGQMVKTFSGWFDVATLKHSLREAGIVR
jgi:hypothetical protein